MPGQLSGVLLDLAGVVWLPRVAQGETPLAILLEPVAPIAERGDTALNAHIQQAVENKSRQAQEQEQEQLAPFLRLRLAKETQYLLLPDTSMQGSFTLHDDYRIPPDPAEIQRISATFNPEEGHVVADNAWASTIHYDCGQGFSYYWKLALPAGTLSANHSGRLNWQGAGWTIDAPHPQQNAHDPRVFCWPLSRQPAVVPLA